MPKVSIIIPIYNVDSFLKECLDSVISQTLKDIEIICINDASTDTSLSIIEDYARIDDRIKMISYTYNKSASQARKDGALLAEGEYILFLDGDDYLEPNTCEELYGIISKKNIEIIHFGTNIINWGNADTNRVQNLEKNLLPHNGALNDEDVFYGCFQDKKYKFQIWNKIYSSNLCKKAFAHIQDGNFTKAQDLYAYYILAYYAKSYVGLPERKYYNYRFGSGITGKNKIDLAQFERFCKSVLVANAISNFTKEYANYKHIGIAEQIRDDLLNDCLGNWFLYLPDQYSKDGFDLLIKYWYKNELIAKISSKYYYDRKIIAQKVLGAKCLEYPKGKTIKTIGIFYHRYALGGVQRVISLLIPIYISMGYTVVLFTDEFSATDEYDLPDKVCRVVLPSSLTITKDDYITRASAFEENLNNYNIDIVFFHAASSRMLLFDLLLIKLQKIPFVLTVHEIAFQSILAINSDMVTKLYIYRIADCVTVLSRIEENYWKALNVNAYYIPNPINIDIIDRDIDQVDKKTILWISRLDLIQKRYTDTIPIMKEVVKEIPDAKLLIVGNEVTANAYQTLIDGIKRNGLEKNIILCGFSPDVSEYYRKASIHILTSTWEAFPMVITESKSYGIPLIMYELPYLEVLRDNCGFISVEQGNTKGMAEAIVKLLSNDQLRSEMGKAAKNSLKSFMSVDISQTWQKIIENIRNKTNDFSKDNDNSDLSIMLQMLLSLHEMACKNNNININNLKTEVIDLKKENDEIIKQINTLNNSRSLKMGRLVTFPIRILHRAILCYRDHGFVYTSKLGIKKVMKIFGIS